MSPGIFRNEISRARTFGFMSDVERLWKAGLALGANLNNTIAIGENKIMNREGLRYPQEFVRHKMLDAVGDLALAGQPLLAAYRSVRGGHRLNSLVVQALFADPEAWTIVRRRGCARPAGRHGLCHRRRGIIRPTLDDSNARGPQGPRCSFGRSLGGLPWPKSLWQQSYNNHNHRLAEEAVQEHGAAVSPGSRDVLGVEGRSGLASPDRPTKAGGCRTWGTSNLA